MKQRIVRILVVIVVMGSVVLPLTSWFWTVQLSSPWLWAQMGYADVSVEWDGVPDIFVWNALIEPTRHGPSISASFFFFHWPDFYTHRWNLPWWLINLFLWPVAAGVWWWSGRWGRSGSRRGFPV